MSKTVSKTVIRGNRVREYVLNMTTDELRVWVRDDLLSWPDDQIDDFLPEELSREETRDE